MAASEYFPVIPALATLCSAFAAGVFATYTIRNNREIARMKATLDLIEKAESSKFYRDLARTFRKALASGDPSKRVPLDKLLRPDTPDEIDTRIKVLFFFESL